MDMAAFFKLHDGLPREGPGSYDDVLWAAEVAQTPGQAAILDAGSGPGGDVNALLQVAPDGTVLAIDGHDGFVTQMITQFSGDPRVTARTGDMMAEPGPFDLIWCAGAIYFIGVTKALSVWKTALKPGGAIAFSQPCLFRSDPPDVVYQVFGGFPVGNADQIAAEIDAAGYDLIDSRPVSDAGWEAYFKPQERRIAGLRPDADAALAAVLDEAEAEIAAWRQYKDYFGYQLCVVRPH